MAGAAGSSSKQTGARAVLTSFLPLVVCPFVASSFSHPLLCVLLSTPCCVVFFPPLVVSSFSHPLPRPAAAVLASCCCAGPLLQVVGTIGPACQSVDVQVAMLEAGMSAAR